MPRVRDDEFEMLKTQGQSSATVVNEVDEYSMAIMEEEYEKVKAQGLYVTFNPVDEELEKAKTRVLSTMKIPRRAPNRYLDEEFERTKAQGVSALTMTNEVSYLDDDFEKLKSRGISSATVTNEVDALDGSLNEKEFEIELEKPKSQKDIDPFLVTFDEGDPENPKNWSVGYRWLITILAGIFVLNSTFASSAPSGITQPVEAHFHFSKEVATLTVSLFVLGYSIGPIVWGPLSEQWGRKPVFVISFAAYTCLQVGDALAPNTAALLLFRLIGGMFASGPLTNSGAVIAEIWDSKTRGQALAIFALAPFAGPVLGPIVGGYITNSGVTWRWVYWTLCAFAGACLAAIVFVIPETYAPIILVGKAARKRQETGEYRYYAAFERRVLPSPSKQIMDIVSKPFILFFYEPMLMAVTLYLSFIYGVIYLEFEAYPFVFGGIYHMTAGSIGLMFLPVIIGAGLGLVLNLVYFEPKYQRMAAECAPAPPPPEERLRICAYLGPAFVISFFWFGWTSYKGVSFWAPMMSGIFLGAGFSMIFLGLINYTIETYLFVSATALAVQTIMRSFAGAGFPLFAEQMFEKLNVHWASTLLGFIALVLMPIPVLLMRYGPALRKRSKFVPSAY